MIALLVEAATPRINYTAKFIFQTHFQVPYQVVIYRPDTPLPDAFIINYTHWDVPSGITIRPSGLLKDEQWYPYPLPTTAILSAIKPFLESPKDAVLWPEDLDVLACLFWALTEYECYDPQFPKDRYGRYDENHLTLIQSGLYAYAWIDILLNQLSAILVQQQPQLKIAPPSWSWSIGVDYDQPYKYLHKPFYVHLGACMRDCFKGHFKAIAKRISVLLHVIKDPFETTSTILELIPRAHLMAFFLLDSHHPYDNRFKSAQKAIQQLLHQLDKEQVAIGLHPGYLTCEQPQSASNQLDGLQKVLNRSITASRQHFLRYQLPHTYRQLISLGILDEYTGGFYSQIGFKYGYSRPFYWFDVLSNQETALQIHPSVIMDRTLLSYLNCTVDEAIDKTLHMQQQLNLLGGHMAIFTHNDTFSNHGEWLGWQKWLNTVVTKLTAEETRELNFK